MPKRPHRLAKAKQAAKGIKSSDANTSEDAEVELASLIAPSNSASPAASAGLEEDATSATATASLPLSKRYYIVAFAVMVGCYQLGRWTCMVQHNQGGDSFLEGQAVGTVVSKHKDTVGEYALTVDKLQAIRQQSQQLLSELEDYYSGHKGGANNILLGAGGWAQAWNFDDDASTGASAKREEKLVDSMARALLNPQQDVFKIGVIGSSVAAGHDNCRYDNYQSQLERTWAPLWNAVGMRLEIQNAGQGGSCGDSHKNQVWCIQQNVSPNSDIIHYSWSYFEVGDPDQGRIERESLVRWTQLLPQAPPVHVINVLQNPRCLTDPPQEVQLFDAYQEYGYNAFCMRYAIVSSQSRQVNGQQDPLFEGQHVGDGFHTTTRYGQNETNQERKDSLGVVLRNWHPGPLGFQLIADALAYTYTRAVVKALDRIKAIMDPKTKGAILPPHDTDAPEAAWWKDRPIVRGHQFREPLFCQAQYCRVDQPPKCLNLEIPTFGYWGASIAPQEDDLNPYKGQLQAWASFESPQAKGDRWHMVNRLEASLYANSPELCQFPDYCAAVEADSSTNGRVVFKLPKMEVGMVSLCFCCGTGVAKAQAMDNVHLEVDFNGRILDRSTWDVYPDTQKCVRVLNDHSGTLVGSTGHAYLSVRLLEGNTETVRISHVITI